MKRRPADAEAATTVGEPRRVVLLGASNLTKSISTVVETAASAWGRPLDVLAALGHGRSYGRDSRVFGRQLSGILECGLWPQLARLPRVPTAGLVTDIGNDLIYEQPVEKIIDWVEHCLDRLAAAEARTVVTLLPIGNLAALSPARFLFLRSILFPYSRLTLDEIRRRTVELNEQVRRLATERGCAVVEQRPVWYGFDPIHIKPWRRSSAWREILAPWSPAPESVKPAKFSLRGAIYLRSRRPELRHFFGFEQRRAQPAARFRDGTTVSIY